MVMLAVAIGVTATGMTITVVATIVTTAAIGATIIVLVALVAHVVTQCATGAAACCGTGGR